MIKYLTGGFGSQLIKRVEIRSETKAYVTNALGVRQKKNGGYYQYHDTFDEAKAYLLIKAESRLKSARGALATAEEQLKTIEGLTDDE